MALSDGGKEQVLLEAQFLNNLAGNLIGIGVLGPVATSIYINSISPDHAILAAWFGILCFGGSFGLHLIARVRLRVLDA